MESPPSTGTCGRSLAGLLVCALLLSPAASLAEPGHELYHGYRADLLEPVPPGQKPVAVEALTPTGPVEWPEPVRRELEARIRSEWTGQLPYGAVHPGVPLWLTYPLVTARVDDRVVVPVVDDDTLPIRGVLTLPGAAGPRRVVLLVDASSSANAPVLYRAGDASGSTERVSVIEAELRALEHLLERMEPQGSGEGGDDLEIGVIAFGEGTWPVASPGTPREELAERVARFRRERDRGEGRTDLVCALWLARDWLEDAPEGYAREVVLLTDGDLPHSGRFTDCRMRRRHGGQEAVDRCEARKNQTVCPATHRFKSAHGASDSFQLSFFARKSRKKLHVYPLVFEPDRRARLYEELADWTGGEMVRVRSPASIEAALPAVVSRRIRGVSARNLSTGASTADLYEPQTTSFEGSLPLARGANDIELRIESERGIAGLFRFRVYAAPHHLEQYLARIRSRNRGLEVEMEQLADEVRELRPGPRRKRIEIELSQESPAAPDPWTDQAE